MRWYYYYVWYRNGKSLYEKIIILRLRDASYIINYILFYLIQNTYFIIVNIKILCQCWRSGFRLHLKKARLRLLAPRSRLNEFPAPSKKAWLPALFSLILRRAVFRGFTGSSSSSLQKGPVLGSLEPFLIFFL